MIQYNCQEKRQTSQNMGIFKDATLFKMRYMMAIFPRKWQVNAGKRASHSQFPATVSFGSNASTAGSLRSGVSTITCNTRGTGSTSSGGSKSKTSTDDKKQATQGAPPRHVWKMATNPDVQQDIKEVMKHLSVIYWMQTTHLLPS